MDYKKRFIEVYMEAQLKDASETMKWASNKMNSYADEFSAVINGKPMKDTPFIIAIMETIAKGLLYMISIVESQSMSVQMKN